MKKLMIRPYEQYTGFPYRTSEKNNGPQYEQRQYSTMAAGIGTSRCYSVIQLLLRSKKDKILDELKKGCEKKTNEQYTTSGTGLPAAVRNKNSHSDRQTDRMTVNCVRSQCKFLSLAIKRVQEPMKGQGGLVGRSTLAALVQDKPP